MSKGGVEPPGVDIHATPAGSMTLLGQRFHPSVALVYGGIGMLMGTVFSDWHSDAKSWLGILSMLLFWGGLVWWVVLWRRSGKSTPASPGTSSGGER